VTRLSVNLNKVALLRNARGGGRPDLLRLAAVCLDAGAAGLTLHPRPDGRHARAADVLDLAHLARDRGAEMNVEGNPFEGPSQTGAPGTGGYAFPGFVALVREARPAQATLVPDAAGQLTSDHGFAVGPDDAFRDAGRLAPVIETLHEAGCRVSLFVDADVRAVRAARAVGADRVELYTGPYAHAAARGDAEADLAACAAAAAEARALGLGLNAGHDLDLVNLGPLLAAARGGAAPGIDEVSIGQALVSDALERGLAATVAAYVALCDGTRPGLAAGADGGGHR
jgi:pyridoxine 5-phosphate synthase